MREDSGKHAGYGLPRTMQVKRKPPSLVDLCVRTAIDNVRYLGDVGETSSELLEKILPHCTVDQLMHVEKCSTVRSSNCFSLSHARMSFILLLTMGPC